METQNYVLSVYLVAMDKLASVPTAHKSTRNQRNCPSECLSVFYQTKESLTVLTTIVKDCPEESILLYVVNWPCMAVDEQQFGGYSQKLNFMTEFKRGKIYAGEKDLLNIMHLRFQLFNVISS